MDDSFYSFEFLVMTCACDIRKWIPVMMTLIEIEVENNQ